MMFKILRTKKYLGFALLFAVLLSVALLAPNQAQAAPRVYLPFIGYLPDFGFADGVVKTVVEESAGLALTITGYLLGVAGRILNATVVFTVQGMSEFIRSAEGIRIGWEIMRDVANIGFIFAIVYMGVSTILGLAGVNWKALLGKLVLAALLVNFSYFFTGVLIDVSNTLTLTLYNRVIEVSGVERIPEGQPILAGLSENAGTGDGVGPPTSGVSGGQDIFNVGISGVYMQALDLETGFNPGEENLTGIYNIIIIGMFGSVLFFILIFAFLAISLLLILRLIVFIVLMTLSPIAYLGWAFPAVKNYTNQWWSALWGQAIFAPLYMLLTLITVNIINHESFQRAMFAPFGREEGSLGANGGFTSFLSGDFSGTIPLIINYALVVGLVIASITIAKSKSASSGSQIATWGGKLTGYVDTLRGKTQAQLRRPVDATGRGLRFAAGAATGAAVAGAGNVIRRGERVAERRFGFRPRLTPLSIKDYAAKAGEDAQKASPDTILGSALKGASVLGGQRLGATMGRAARAKLESEKKKFEGLSNTAIKARAASATATPDERAAAVSILADKKDLKTEGGFNKELVERAMQSYKNAGQKPKDIKSLAWQFAETNDDRAEAVPSVSTADYEKLDYEKYFESPDSMTDLFESMLKTLHKGKIQKIMERDDTDDDGNPREAAMSLFVRKLVDRYISTHGGTRPDINGAADWIADPSGINNPRLAEWMKSRAGDDFLKRFPGLFA